MIDGDPALSPGLKGSDLLVRLLATRIHRVYAAGAGDWPDDDVEHVHELRVAVRRMREAMAIAAPLFPKKSVERANRRARDFGRALGERRIFDVFLEEVRAIGAREGLALDAFLTFLEARRDRATIEICFRYPKRKLIRHGLDLLAMTMWPKDQETSLAQLAPARLTSRADEVESQLACVAEENAYDAHHELRIAFKHLRYSAEILASAWPEVIDPTRIVAPIKTMQDALGSLNDARELVALAREHGGGGADLTKFIELSERARGERYLAAAGLVRELGPKVIAESRRIVAALAPVLETKV
jgi:CHAD domain-containing protein